MSVGFLLNKCGDRAIVEGKLVRITGVDLIRQKWLIKVRKFKGEWVLDKESGVPYFEDIFKKIVSRKRIEDIFFKLTAEMDGVQTVTSVKVEDVDPVARSVNISVDAILDGDESTVFKYDGALAPDACGLPNDSLELSDLADLLFWFDAQDLSGIDYQPPTVFNVDNKAAVGNFQGVYGPVLEGVSALGNKRSALLSNDAGTKHFNIVDTPAYRHSDGAFSLFAVFRAKQKAVPPGADSLNLVSLDGYDDVTTDRVFYNLNFDYDTGSPNNANFVLKSSVFGGSTVTVNTTNNLNDYDSYIVQLDIDSAGVVTMYANGSVQTISGSPTTIRKLNGLGNIGAEILTTGLLDNYFNGNIGEVAFFGRKLSDTERGNVTDYLKNKWGIL